MLGLERVQSLDKTNRINLLFDYYRPLLTEKQQLFLQCYFHDDLSLGEIAAEFEISRQAVYEHIRRAEQMLEEYELKLNLAEQDRVRELQVEHLKKLVNQVQDEHLREQFKRHIADITQS
ncbi:MAG: hypothetical protein RLZZ267_350 [Bacillota bacterium]